MKTAIEIIRDTWAKHDKHCLSYSGGGDSTVLLDIIVKKCGFKPTLIYCDDQMGYDSTLPFVREVAKSYDCDIIVAKGDRTPPEQWTKRGWPMLGKLAARKWMQTHKEHGIKIDVSSCCRDMKIAPARKATKGLGATIQYVGTRGNNDDALRGMRAIKDGAYYFSKGDNLHIAQPLLGWTDLMIRRYTAQNNLPIHPARKAGAVTLGCLYCGGGAQFDNSGFRVLRLLNPPAWRWFMVDCKAGEIILAVKYDRPLKSIQYAIDKAGGLKHLADTRPWIFDFLRKTPLKGYNR